MWQRSLRLLLPVILLMISFGPGSGKVRAVGDFTKSLNVSYAVADTGETRVTYEVRLKNNFSTIYARQYALTINSPDVNDVRVLNQDGKAEKFELNQTENQSSVTISFSEADKVIGRDRERLFTVSYTSKDIASIYGNVLEISLPKLADPDSYSQYNVVITAPERFGVPTLVEPAQFTFDQGGGQSVLRFTNVGKNTGISALFGESQTYDVGLVYHMQNTSQNVGVVQVALPPDTAFQRVSFRDIQPRPERITSDGDGNWIAEFRVAGQAQQQVKVKAAVTIFARPQTMVAATNPFKPAGKLFGDDRSLYLQSTLYWPTSNQAIQKIIQTQRTPQQIYHYVVDTLQYNYRRFQQPDATTRLGALGALQDPTNAVCLEYSDLFVALTRAAGIPARRITGYAVTQNSRLRPLSLVADVLHAWPEYYDAQQNVWVPVDPTWGDTTGGLDYFSKLDLRHIVFAIQGQNDERPLPAGMYKIPGQEEKDVTVTLAPQAGNTIDEPIQVEKRPALFPQFGVPTEEVFVLRNTSGAARYNVEVALGVQGQASLLSSPKQTIPVLLPYQEETIAVSLTGTSWIHPQKAHITLFVENDEHTYEVSVRKAFIHPAWRWVAVGGVVALFSFLTGCVLVFILRRFRPVRRKS